MMATVNKRTVHDLSDSDSEGTPADHSALTNPGKRTHEFSDSDSNDELNDIHHKKRQKITYPGSQTKNTYTHQNTDDLETKKNVTTCSGASDGRSEHKPICKYGKECYRKNPLHFKEFQHPPSKADKRDKPETINTTSQPSLSLSVQEKLNKNNYNFLFTHVTGLQENHNNVMGIQIKDILSPELGNLVSSVQFNYCIDIPWLIQQYHPTFRSCPLLIVHGEQRESKTRLDLEAMKYSHVKLCQAKLEIMYGTHHTKMMLLHYDKGLRVVIHTANLVQQDWHQKTQGVWISPLFPKLVGPSSGGESPTHFKRDLVEYLSAYKSTALNVWVELIKNHDLSTARVHLVGSLPGRHTGEKKFKFGHMKLRTILSKSGPTSATKVKSWPVIGQFSSIGSLGSSKDNWLCSEWLSSLAATQCIQTMVASLSPLKLVYPSKENVRRSLEGYAAGASLPYSINTAKKQPYLNDFLHQWKCEKFGRSRASPHIKSYTRISPDMKQAAWFLVTSANLSKAAWGVLEKNQSQLMIRSYELGVLFLPQHFDKDEVFNLEKFPLPFDVPLTPYGSNDRPWIWDIPYKDKPDSKGVMWVPS